MELRTRCKSLPQLGGHVVKPNLPPSLRPPVVSPRCVNRPLHTCNLPVTRLCMVFWYDKIGVSEYTLTGGMSCLSADKQSDGHALGAVCVWSLS
jgi:hypothetical protein